MEEINEVKPVIMILERRAQRRADLSSADVMKILRKRAAKSGRRETGADSDAAG